MKYGRKPLAYKCVFHFVAVAFEHYTTWVSVIRQGYPRQSFLAVLTRPRGGTDPCPLFKEKYERI